MTDLILELIDRPEPKFAQDLHDRLDEFNHARWEVKEQLPLGVRVSSADGALLAGAFGRTFGRWLLIDSIWVSESARGRNLGTRLLMALEDGARARGCAYALLDTLNFQARPFYERFGYVVRWTQDEYPRDGQKHFMTKNLTRT